MKIPFSIKYRDKIESGEFKVVCGTDAPWEARIICYNFNGDTLIVLVKDPYKQQELAWTYTQEGKLKAIERKDDSDLFLITPEPELTEFEKAVAAIYEHCGVKELALKEKASKLLALARMELVSQGYVIEKNIPNDKDMKAMLMLEYDKGRFDVLKDLPMWRTIEDATEKRTDENDCVTTEKMLIKGLMDQDDYMILPPDCMVNRKIMCIPVRELKKLPGFKENSHE